MTNGTVDEVYSKLQSKKRPLPQLAGINLMMRLIYTSCGAVSLGEKSGSRDNSPSVARSCRFKDFSMMWELKVSVTELFGKTEGYLTFVMKIPCV